MYKPERLYKPARLSHSLQRKELSRKTKQDLQRLYAKQLLTYLLTKKILFLDKGTKDKHLLEWFVGFSEGASTSAALWLARIATEMPCPL